MCVFVLQSHTQSELFGLASSSSPNGLLSSNVGRKIRIQINHNKWEEVEKNERSVFDRIQSRDRIITPLTELITK